MPVRDVRVVVTGSRHWDEITVVARALLSVLRELPPESRLVVTHGDARGADKQASLVVKALAQRGHAITEDRHPVTGADWKRLGLAAGPLRNAAMLDLDPVLVVAFRAAGKSDGTDGTIQMARDRDIPVLLFRPDGSHGMVTGRRSA